LWKKNYGDSWRLLFTYFLSLFFIFSRLMELCTSVLAPWKFVTWRLIGHDVAKATMFDSNLWVVHMATIVALTTLIFFVLFYIFDVFVLSIIPFLEF
jgi:hypothetical protein